MYQWDYNISYIDVLIYLNWRILQLMVWHVGMYRMTGTIQRDEPTSKFPFNLTNLCERIFNVNSDFRHWWLL